MNEGTLAKFYTPEVDDFSVENGDEETVNNCSVKGERYMYSAGLPGLCIWTGRNSKENFSNVNRYLRMGLGI